MGTSKTNQNIIELSIATVALLIITRVLFLVRGSSIVGPALSTIVAVIFIYVPIAILWFRRRAIDFLDRDVKSYLSSIKIFTITSVIVFPLFLVGAHIWQIYIMGYKTFYFSPFPNFLNVTFFQLLLVALPEEFYFRGYFQSTINQVFLTRRKILGVELGWGFIITAAVFAIAHSIVYYQWWHFAIFFPALLFGYLRERTGSITASVLFHATSNIVMDWVVRCYR